MKKRIVSLMLVLCVCLSICPVALAEEDTGDFIIRTQSVTNEDGTVTEEQVLTGYRGEGGDVVIPDGVTAIGMGFAWGFMGNTVITSVVMPDSVTRIGENAFRGCPNLRRVRIGNGVTEISEYTFYECPSLTEVVIPDSVTKIGVNAFGDCTALERVEIPASVECIDNAAFCNCTALREVVLSEGLITIGDQAFQSCAALERIDIPASVTRIDYSAFAGCASLGEVVFHDGLTEIGEGAFMSCTSLERVDIPASVESIGNNAFMSCTSLKEVNIANPDVDVDSTAFCYTNLTSYTQGGVVKTLGENGTQNNDGKDPETVEDRRQSAIDQYKNTSGYRERLENNRNALGQIDEYAYRNTAVTDEIQAQSDEICRGFSTDTEKVTAIHAWMIENIYYDYPVYLRTSPRVKDGQDTQSSENVLNNKRAVCEGYSRLFQALCWAQKIPCVYVAGNANGGNHAWNAVQLDGEWLWVDSTWDTFNKYYGEGNWERGDRRLDYFLCSTEFLSTDHGASKVEVNLSDEQRRQLRINEYIELITGEVRNGDREASEWAKDELIAAMEAQMFPYGYGRPNYTRSIDRDEFCRVAVQMIEQYTGQDIADYAKSKGLTYQDPFTDWHSENVSWIYALGIIKGTSETTFSPNQDITRQEAAVILARVARLLGVEPGDELSFTDENTFASWASEDIAYLSGLVDPTTGNRVMQGTGGGRFSPEDGYTWEQSLITFLRLFRSALA